MKKKLIISIVAIIICTAALLTVILLNNNQKTEIKNNSTLKSSSDILSAGKADKGDTLAGFSFQYTDRLAGCTATNIESTDSTIKVTYGNAGYVSKAQQKSSDDEAKKDENEYTETINQIIDGMDVTFKGSNDLVYLAIWQSGSYNYTISVNNGISAEDMVEYVKATR